MPNIDVIVVGGGPAGMMAAGNAAESGAQTILLEKMDRPGRKLRITGKGRCNLTNTASLEDFIDHFGSNGRFLHSTFSRFFTTDLIAFMEELGVKTVEERGGRVFPVHGDAQKIVAALLAWLDDRAVVLRTGSKVESLLVTDGRVTGVQVTHGEPRSRGEKRREAVQRYQAPRVILATGGASYPGTGSTGDGYRLAKATGHTITPVRPALVPLEIGGDIAPRLQGLTLRNVKVCFFSRDDLLGEGFGEMLFTHFGVSGPVILSLSRRVVDALRNGNDVELAIDLKPALGEETLDARLRRDFDAHGKRQLQTILKDLLPRTLIPVCIELTGISSQKPAGQITSEERSRLRAWLKDFRLPVCGHRSFREAIITAGGVDLSQVDPRSMESRLVEGLYFAGELLDLDADTGGYNLQAAFSTGWLAGRSAAASLKAL